MTVVHHPASHTEILTVPFVRAHLPNQPPEPLAPQEPLEQNPSNHSNHANHRTSHTLPVFTTDLYP